MIALGLRASVADEYEKEGVKAEHILRSAKLWHHQEKNNKFYANGIEQQK